MSEQVERAVAGAASRDAFSMTWGACTDTGKVRRHNEDSFVADAGLFVVADGMGGHQAGDVASGLVADICRDAATRLPLAPSDLAGLVDRANSRVYETAAQSGLGGMGTTLVGAAVVDNGGDESLVVFNVGDSRCYLFDADAGLRQLTRDHSVVQELIDAGALTAEAAASHAERNVVTRAVGIEPSVAADYFVVPVPADGSLRMLLCSDGVSGQVTADAMERVLAHATTPGDAASQLVDAVLDGPAPDNATAVVVDVAWTDLPADDEVDAEITGPRPVRDPLPSPSAEVAAEPAPALIDAVPLQPSTEPQAEPSTVEITEVPS